MEKQSPYYDQISHILSQKMLEEEEVNHKISSLRFQEGLIKGDVDLKVDKLDKLQLYLDKLSFANTAYRAKSSPISCLSADELDKQKLQFLMQHRSKTMANEKRLLREIKREAGGTALNELDAPIEKLNEQMESSHLYLYRTDFEEIHREMRRHQVAREKAVANAAVGGALWSSLGSKKHVQEEVKVMNDELDELRSKQVEARNEVKLLEKKLRVLEKQIIFLQKQLKRY